MTADNTSSEFALLTYAHHIVDTLANSASQGIACPSTNNFIYYRIHPIFTPAGMGDLWSASLESQSQYGYLWSSSVDFSSNAYRQLIYRSIQFSQSTEGRDVGHSLRCVAR